MSMGMPMFYGFDPFLLIIGVIATVIAMAAQGMVTSAFSKYSQIGNSRNMSGAEAAVYMLSAEGINDVQVNRYEGGMLSDHYNPGTKIINLSPQVYDGRSVAAVGIACHEAGHALQHAQGYAFLALRNFLVPVVGIGSRLAYPMIIFGFILGYTGLAQIGLLLFAVVFLFQLITLPVEWNASSRSKHALISHGIVASGEEAQGVSAVLNAAALTYLAAAISTLLYLLYFAMRLGLLGGNRSGDE